MVVLVLAIFTSLVALFGIIEDARMEKELMALHTKYVK